MTRAVVGTVGLWSRGFRELDPARVADAAAEAEALGFGALWVPGRSGGDVLDRAATLLARTTRIAVATGVLNIWMHEAAEVAARSSALHRAHRRRFVLGVGVGHARLVEAAGRRYSAPFAEITRFLDDLDDVARGRDAAPRVLAALGPRMLALARERAAGAHPYLGTPEHTRFARDRLGPEPLLAPELHVVRRADPAAGRAIARRALARNLELPHYRASFERLGYGADDLRDGGSDRLIDAVVAWGSDEQIARRVVEHLDAGADHVCLQVIEPTASTLPLDAWRALAAELQPLIYRSLESDETGRRGSDDA